MISPFLSILLIVCCSSGKEKIYTGSTPADTVIRSFLGIPLSDSVDFIRWKFILQDKWYELRCNYGIGKANTNGFINGGAKVELSGECRKEKNYYQFQNGTKTLKAADLRCLLPLTPTDQIEKRLKRRTKQITLVPSNLYHMSCYFPLVMSTGNVLHFS